MSNNIAEAIAAKNEVIAQQSASLDAVLTALEGKAAGGGLDYLNYCTSIEFGNNFPSATPDIKLPLATKGASLFSVGGVTPPYTSVKVTFGKPITRLDYMAASYLYTSTLKRIEIIGDLSHVTSYANMAQNNAALVEIKATLDFTSVSTANSSSFSGSNTRPLSALTYVRYAENTLKVNHAVYCPALSNESLVSIANGLIAGAHVLTLMDTAKERISSIMGTINNSSSYDIFTEDSSGDVSLLSFITDTKGWTIA